VCVAEVLVLGSNSVQCTSCQKWVQSICRGCSNPVISTGLASVAIGASANLEVVDKFCYLGDMLSVDGKADAAVEARIRIGWSCLPTGIYH